MTNNDRIKALENKIEKLAIDNNRLNQALTHLTEAFMIMIEEQNSDMQEGIDSCALYSENT